MRDREYYIQWQAPITITQSVSMRLKYSPEIPKRGGYYRLTDYIYAGNLKGWDLSRDVNYLYAKIIYPPEDIRRRIRRVCNDPDALWGDMYEALGALLNVHPKSIPVSICYAKTGCFYVYSTVMQYLSRKENKLHYDDAIQLED